MKKIIYVLLIIFANSCKKNESILKYDLKGKINVKTGKIYLLNYEENKVIDSANISDGQFYFRGIINSPDYYRLNVKDSPYMNGFYIEGGEQTIKIKDTQESYSFNVKGGVITETWSNLAYRVIDTTACT